ncbi:MAG: hypothetical protein GF341_10945 [candidate division Zixibacteria bacterium]|nr:hypothetical protein [candidate division Zixibacteria bacterium]
MRTQGAGTYTVSWQSINAGGGTVSSASYDAQTSAGQTAIGAAASASYEAGIGYWYGVDSGGTSDCDCPWQGDLNADGVRDAVDLNQEINALFFNGPDPQDPLCPTTRANFNNDAAADAVDLNLLIQHLFFNGPPPVDPCL